MSRTEHPGTTSTLEHELVAAILAVCGDYRNEPAYRKAVREYPRELIETTLSETRLASRTGRIRKTTGAYFMDTLKRLAVLRTRARAQRSLDPSGGSSPAGDGFRTSPGRA